MPAALGPSAVKAASIAELEAAMQAAKTGNDPDCHRHRHRSDARHRRGRQLVASGVPEVSDRAEVNEARKAFEAGAKAQRLVN